MLHYCKFSPQFYRTSIKIGGLSAELFHKSAALLPKNFPIKATSRCGTALFINVFRGLIWYNGTTNVLWCESISIVHIKPAVPGTRWCSGAILYLKLHWFCVKIENLIFCHFAFLWIRNIIVHNELHKVEQSFERINELFDENIRIISKVCLTIADKNWGRICDQPNPSH